MISLEGATFGCELELGDIDTRIKIPTRLGKWDFKDGSIANSNGTANDPKKILNHYGSEIQVAPASSINELVDRVGLIYDLFPKKDFNFTTNLHPHIRVPGLKDDLQSLKRIAHYLHIYGEELFHLVDPIPVPEKTNKGAWKRYLRRKHSHHTLPSARAYHEMRMARNCKEFYEAHAPKDRKGKPQFHLVQRAGINLMQLWSDTETIEFRCFTMSPDLEKMRNAFRFTRMFLMAVNHWWKPEELVRLKFNKLTYQKFWPYNSKLDKIFQLTNVRHNKRSVVRANYEKLISKGILKASEL